MDKFIKCYYCKAIIPSFYYSEEDIECPICNQERTLHSWENNISQLKDKLSRRDRQVKNRNIQIKDLKEKSLLLRVNIEVAIEMIADSYGYDPKEKYCECDCQAVNVLQRALTV